MLILCGVADFLDGFVARKFGSDTDLGVQLDSLADMVSFGVVPGAIIFQFLSYTFEANSFLAWPGFIITVFACLRLAKFNLEEDTSGDFIGLPTPSATGFVAGLLLVHHLHPAFSAKVLLNPIFLYGIVIALSVLMVSKIGMISLKFKGSQWKENEWRYILICLFVLLFIFVREWSFSAIILIYIIFSIIKHFTNSR